ncbi:DUF1837 domain-containing protein [Brevibacillus centrosporus]|uniref:HamA C-terminal domain-containing protein n=1 Tax=Brevibacillus centrosporus TaxID=54910 RepID=UPI003B02E6F9
MVVPQKTVATANLIEEAIDSLLRGDGRELEAYLSKVEAEVPILNTRANVHCYIISLDGNDQPRVKDLAKAVASRIIDYAIPRGELIKAQEYMLKHNSFAKIAELQKKARSLFTTLSNTGEGGEMLLYMLIQNFLRLPQIMCKMSLKTNSQLHYNGSDALHMTFDKKSQKLALYWGESKLYQSIDNAITECLDSIKPFLCDDGGSGSRQTRDLQLMSSFLDLGDPDLENALLRYLDPDDPHFNKLQYRGACLIGFDDTFYPKNPNTKTEEELIQEVQVSLKKWEDKISTKIINRVPLDSIIMEIFLVPFPSVEDFRKSFLGEIQNA